MAETENVLVILSIEKCKSIFCQILDIVFAFGK